MEVEGLVTTKPFATGTKSEHQAIYLETPEGELVLRRPGVNPFEIDPTLQALVGDRVRFSGTVRNGTLFVSGWKVLSENQP
jgi:hypothetical protein